VRGWLVGIITGATDQRSRLPGRDASASGCRVYGQDPFDPVMGYVLTLAHRTEALLGVL
jgi:hypothetical protein